MSFDQRLGEQLPLDARFRDEAGETVELRDFFNGRPVIVALVYYECPMLCTMVLNGLVDSLKGVPFDAGDGYQVVLVSIDPGETPELAAKKKRAYVADYGREGAAAGFHFLTGETTQIDRIADAIGYRYVYDAATDQYAHPGGIVVATPAGVVSHYFYGFAYRPRDVRLALVEASQGQIGSPVDQILLRCFQYDPVSGRYGFAIMSAMRVLGVLVVAGLAAFIVTSARRQRRDISHEASEGREPA